MRFTALTTMLALAAHITSSIAAYTVTAFQGGGCNQAGSAGFFLTIVGSNTNNPGVETCFQVPFTATGFSVTGCTNGGTITPFTDGNCITPASVTIPNTGILCLDLENTPFKSFSVTGC